MSYLPSLLLEVLSQQMSRGRSKGWENPADGEQRVYMRGQSNASRNLEKLLRISSELSLNLHQLCN